MTSHTQLLVYNSENRFVGFFYQFTCRVERTKGLKDKTEFWDRLLVIFVPFTNFHPCPNICFVLKRAIKYRYNYRILVLLDYIGIVLQDISEMMMITTDCDDKLISTEECLSRLPAFVLEKATRTNNIILFCFRKRHNNDKPISLMLSSPLDSGTCFFAARISQQRLPSPKQTMSLGQNFLFMRLAVLLGARRCA